MSWSFLDAVGTITVVVLSLKLAFFIWKNYRNFVLAQQRPPAVDLKSLGQWAGMREESPFYAIAVGQIVCRNHRGAVTLE